jgi:penicillin-binding protein 1A
MILLINFGVIGNMVSIKSLENLESVLPSEIISNNGIILGKYDKGNQSYCKYDAISANVINALLATNEKDFYGHNGFLDNDSRGGLFYLIMGKHFHSAGSITEQLARQLLRNNGNVFVFDDGFKRYVQRIQECILTVKLERNFTKQEILALYLNTSLFGDSTYGIGNASYVFFNKDAASLTMEEAATLVGMLRGVRIYNPRLNSRTALLRRNVVIELMKRDGFVSELEAEEAKNKPIVLREKETDFNKNFDPYFSNKLREELEIWCKHHNKADGSSYNLYQDGLKIYTAFKRKEAPVDMCSKTIYITSINDRYGNTLEIFPVK